MCRGAEAQSPESRVLGGGSAHVHGVAAGTQAAEGARKLHKDILQLTNI